jgi:hypothetical protein
MTNQEAKLTSLVDGVKNLQYAGCRAVPTVYVKRMKVPQSAATAYPALELRL